jgi:arylsulfatase A-like enzyme
LHLPARMRSLAFDPAAPSSLLDITPSLYYLLGHRPIMRNDLFGRPLFTATAEEAAGYLRSSYLVASSYGPVYALLEAAGHSLFVTDAVEYDDHFYEWGEGQDVSTDTVTREIRADRRQKIHDDVNEIAHFYHFTGAAPD